ncbi:MAG: ATP-binding protein [Hyphomicrobium sp.]
MPDDRPFPRLDDAEVRSTRDLNPDFNAIFDASPTPLLVIAPPDWIIVAANRARLIATDTTREQNLGRKLFDVFPDDPNHPEADGVQNLTSSLQRVVATGKTDVMPVQRYALSDATGAFVERWWNPINTPILDDEGNVSLVIHRVEEVTELIRLRGEMAANDMMADQQQSIIDQLRSTEAALRSSEALLRSLNADLELQILERSHVRSQTWRLTPELLGVANREGFFTSTNPAWSQTLGWAEAELAQVPFLELVHPEDRETTVAAFGILQRGEPVLRFENRYRTKTGDFRWISWVAVPEGDQIYCGGRDVSAAKAQEAKLAEAQEVLRQSQKLDAMGQLTGGVAHDFNNLLTPIIGSLDMLVRRKVGSDRERRLIEGALQSAERAKTLVQRLLAFARRQPLQPTSIDVRRLINGMVDLIASTSGPRISLRVAMSDNLPPALADPNQLEMAVLNLAVNAKDAMPDGGTLTISAARESVRTGHRSKLRQGHYVRLSVEDTGTGMDEATLARAIEPFFSTKGIGRGTGLGLSMVHGLATQLDGGLKITSRLGEGTVVDLWFPTTSVLAEKQDGFVGDSAGHRPALGTAMLVDDEELVRLSTADMLMDLGYEVVEARSGEEALRLIDGGIEPDLVVTDHLMPGMTGVELAKALRSSRPALPLLIISGYAEEDGIDPSLARLTKPFRNAELAASLAALSERYTGDNTR